MKEHIMLTMIW